MEDFGECAVSIDRRHLAKQLAAAEDISVAEAERSIESLWLIIADHLRLGRAVWMAPIGRLIPQMTKAVVRRNPFAGTKVLTPAHPRLKIKTNPKLFGPRPISLPMESEV